MVTSTVSNSSPSIGILILQQLVIGQNQGRLLFRPRDPASILPSARPSTRLIGWGPCTVMGLALWRAPAPATPLRVARTLAWRSIKPFGVSR